MASKVSAGAPVAGLLSPPSSYGRGVTQGLAWCACKQLCGCLLVSGFDAVVMDQTFLLFPTRKKIFHLSLGFAARLQG